MIIPQNCYLQNPTTQLYPEDKFAIILQQHQCGVIHCLKITILYLQVIYLCFVFCVILVLLLLLCILFLTCASINFVMFQMCKLQIVRVYFFLLFFFFFIFYRKLVRVIVYFNLFELLQILLNKFYKFMFHHSQKLFQYIFIMLLK